MRRMPNSHNTHAVEAPYPSGALAFAKRDGYGGMQAGTDANDGGNEKARRTSRWRAGVKRGVRPLDVVYSTM